MNVQRSRQKDTSQLFGATICASSGLMALGLLVGVQRKSYWAVALPVLTGALGALSVAFWVGWTLYSTPIEAPLEE